MSESNALDHIIKLIKQGKNVLCTGPGGCGKSYILRKLKETFTNMYITATTGVSACNIGGTTLHSFAGIGVADLPKEELLNKVYKHVKAPKNWKNVKLLAIDEVSMLGKNLFDKLDYIARKMRRNESPFGGIQLLLVGDMYQLPPVKDDWIFLHPEWQKFNFQTVELQKPYRFTSKRYHELLLRARIAELTDDDWEILNDRYSAHAEKKGDIYIEVENNYKIIPTTFYPKRESCDEHNRKSFDKLQSKEHIFTASDRFVLKTPNGNTDMAKSMLDMQIAPEIKLKEGCQVMCTYNIPDLGLYNGSRGVITNITENNEVDVSFVDGKTRRLGVVAYEYENDDIHYIRKQIPLILGYAFTIHKSQSLSLDYVILDLGNNVFAPGQFYVALSRVRSEEGLYIKCLNTQTLKCDPVVKKWLSGTEKVIFD